MGIVPLSTAHAQVDNQTNGMNELMTNLDAKVRYGGRGYEVWPEMYFPLEHSSKGRGDCIRRRHRFSIQRSVCCRPPGCQLGVIQLLLPHQLAGDVAVVGGCFFSSVESHTSPQAHDDGFRRGQEFKRVGVTALDYNGAGDSRSAGVAKLREIQNSGWE